MIWVLISRIFHRDDRGRIPTWSTLHAKFTIFRANDHKTGKPVSALVTDMPSYQEQDPKGRQMMDKIVSLKDQEGARLRAEVVAYNFAGGLYSIDLKLMLTTDDEYLMVYATSDDFPEETINFMLGRQPIVVIVHWQEENLVVPTFHFEAWGIDFDPTELRELP